MMDRVLTTTNPGNRISIPETQPLLGSAKHPPLERETIVGMIILGTFFMAGVLIGTYLLLVEGQDVEIAPIPYSFVSRAGWHAKQPLTMKPLHPPIRQVMLTFTETGNCDDENSCEKLLQGLQRHHMGALNLTDIAYNFMVSTDGVIYEGRGWEIENPFPAANETLSIAFIGTSNDNSPTKIQIEEVKLLLEECIEWQQLDPCYRIAFDKNYNLSSSAETWLSSQTLHLCD